MIVVSDTSPLNYLIIIEAVEVLPKLFAEVVIPQAVAQELNHARTPERVRTWLASRPTWLRIEEAGPPDPGLERLGAGEAEAITLARKLKADHLLIDERDGTKVARNVGLSPLSLLAVLKKAAEEKLIDLPQSIRRLKTETTYRMTDEIAEAVTKSLTPPP